MASAEYLHYGSATPLRGPILEHGGEALAAKKAFSAQKSARQQDLINFLNNLVLFKLQE